MNGTTLTPNVRNAKLIKFFKKMIVTKNKENFLFSVYDHYGVKLLTRLRLHFSSQKEHKFRLVLVIQSALCMDIMLKLKILNTTSCVAIFILFRDLSASIILTKLTLFSHNSILKNKLIFCCTAIHPANLMP